MNENEKRLEREVGGGMVVVVEVVDTWVEARVTAAVAAVEEVLVVDVIVVVAVVDGEASTKRAVPLPPFRVKRLRLTKKLKYVCVQRSMLTTTC
jgi:hypothetical protein